MWALVAMSAWADPVAAAASGPAPALAEALPAPALGARLVEPELPKPRLVLMPRPGVRRINPAPAWNATVVLPPMADDFALELLSGVVGASVEGWVEQRDLRRRPLGEPLPPLR